MIELSFQVTQEEHQHFCAQLSDYPHGAGVPARPGMVLLALRFPKHLPVCGQIWWQMRYGFGGSSWRMPYFLQEEVGLPARHTWPRDEVPFLLGLRDGEECWGPYADWLQDQPSPILQQRGLKMAYLLGGRRWTAPTTS